MGSLSFVLLLLRAHGAHSESLNLLLGRATFDSHRGRLAVSYNLMGIATSEVAKGLGLEKGRGVSMKEPPVFTKVRYHVGSTSSISRKPLRGSWLGALS